MTGGRSEFLLMSFVFGCRFVGFPLFLLPSDCVSHTHTHTHTVNIQMCVGLSGVFFLFLFKFLPFRPRPLDVCSVSLCATEPEPVALTTGCRLPEFGRFFTLVLHSMLESFTRSNIPRRRCFSGHGTHSLSCRSLSDAPRASVAAAAAAPLAQTG